MRDGMHMITHLFKFIEKSAFRRNVRSMVIDPKGFVKTFFFDTVFFNRTTFSKRKIGLNLPFARDISSLSRDFIIFFDSLRGS